MACSFELSEDQDGAGAPRKRKVDVQTFITSFLQRLDGALPTGRRSFCPDRRCKFMAAFRDENRARYQLSIPGKASALTRVIILCAFAPGAASAFEPERARGNLAQESAECAAYFMSVAAAPVLRPETKDRLDGYGKDLFEFSIKLTNRKLTQTRVELALQAMKRELGNNWRHLSLLNSKYGGLCHGFIDAPEARMQYWLDRRD